MLLRRLRGYPLQLFVVTVLPLIILLVGLAVGGLGLHRQAMRMLVGERDERAARAAAAAISEQLNHRAAAVRSLAARAMATNAAEQTLADAEFLLNDFDKGLALFAADGRLLAASSTSEFWHTPEVTSRLAQISPAVESQFLPVFVDIASDQPLALVVNAAPEGVIAVGAFFPGNMIQRILTNVFSGSGGSAAFVIDGQGQRLSQTGGPSHLDHDLMRHPGVVGALRGDSGTNYLSAEDTELVIAFSPVAVVNWAMVIEEPWMEATDPLLRATELAPLLLVPLLVIAVAGLWFGLRQIVQPLQDLEQKATELAWGEFSSIEEPVGGIAEIQRLQAELIHMAQKVKSAQQSLRGYLGAVTTGQEEERRRLARELHDETIQSLIALNQRIQMVQMSDNGRVQGDQLTEMEQMTTQIIADLRRVTRALRPNYLEDLGLIPALDMLARDTSTALGIPIKCRTSGTETRLRPEVELALYRMAQEGLNNVARHARASQVMVGLDFVPDGVTLTIADDGSGFVVPESPAEMTPLGHFGLLGIHERAELIGGNLTIESQPGEGTSLVITLQQEDK